MLLASDVLGTGTSLALPFATFDVRLYRVIKSAYLGCDCCGVPRDILVVLDGGVVFGGV